jgi:hypothetical protein
MAWIETNNNIRPIQDVNAKINAIDGDITEEEAQALLAEFLIANPAFTLEMIAGIKIYPMQELLLKGWMRNDFNMAVWSRGLGKSLMAAVFATLWAIYNPNHRIVIMSFAFRASRRILEQCEKFVNDKEAGMLRACYPLPLQRKTDEWKWVLPNGSSILCLPLGDGTKIRGIRADTMIVDEYAYMPETIINEVLRPFLASNSKIKEQLQQREREDELISRGLMTEAEREIIDDRKKVIFMSSASYTFEHMYKTYCDWCDLLTKETRAKDLKEAGLSYFISRLGYEAAPEGLLNMKQIEEDKRGFSESMFNREYGAIFEGDSDGYFRAAKMVSCSIEDGGTPTLELVGDRLSEYVVAIDPSLSGSESSDHFAMCVLKIIQRLDGKKIGMVVHSYAVAGGNLKDHALYLHYLLTNFNVVYLAIDASQGNEVEFVNMCNQSERFKRAKIDLIDIECEFAKDNFNEMPEQIKKSYNRTIGRIVQKQPFGSSFQKAANEYLQGCFDHKGVMFAGKIAANSDESGKNIDIGSEVVIPLLKDHEELRELSPSQFIEHQDNLLDLTRKECSMIQVRQSSLGTQNWDLPQNIKRTGGPNKVRKDSYSALLLGVWAIKMYLDSQTIPAEEPQQDFPYLLV